MSGCGNGFASDTYANNVLWTVTDNIMTGASGWAIHYVGAPADISGNDFTGASNGVYLRGAHNFTLNGNSNTWDLADAATAVSVEYTSNLTIQDLTIVGDGGTGVFARNGINGIVIDGLESCGKATAVSLQHGSNHIVKNSNFGTANTGVALSGTNSVQVLDNNFYNVSNEVADGGSNTTISGSQMVTSDPWCQGPNVAPIADAGADHRDVRALDLPAQSRAVHLDPGLPLDQGPDRHRAPRDRADLRL